MCMRDTTRTIYVPVSSAYAIRKFLFGFKQRSSFFGAVGKGQSTFTYNDSFILHTESMKFTCSNDKKKCSIQIPIGKCSRYIQCTCKVIFFKALYDHNTMRQYIRNIKKRSIKSETIQEGKKTSMLNLSSLTGKFLLSLHEHD